MQDSDHETHVEQIRHATGWPGAACRMAGRMRSLIYDRGDDNLTQADHDALAAIAGSWARGERGARS
jgi:hypothetical protein